MTANPDPDVIAFGRDGWTPEGKPDPLTRRRNGLVGAPLPRLDGMPKVTGTARFAAEVPMEGMVYAALAYSTIAKGRIAALEVGEAERAPGVVLVMTHRNAPRLNPPPGFLTAEKAAFGDSLPIMGDDRVYWNGQPIAVVLARTQEQADHACSLVRATYAAEPAMTAFDEAKAGGTRPAEFAGHPLAFASGDAEAVLARPAVPGGPPGPAAVAYKVDAVYTTPRHNHNAIEPHAATIAWDGGELFVHDTTQGVRHEAWSLAQVFGLEEDQVHVSSPFLGGGFGGKGLWQHQVLGAAADGRFEALVHTGTTAKTRANALPEPFIQQTMTMYGAGSMNLEVRTVELDMLSNTFMRAPGEAVGSFALESAVDELACQMGIDPVELRLRNEPPADPVSGLPFSSRNLAEAYRAGAERFGWHERDPRPGARREGEWLTGLGTAATTFPYVRMPGGAARITITRDGRARVEVAAHEMGMGTATAQTQVAAERLGLPADRVSFALGDSSLPGLVLAGGSQQTASIGAAVIAAHRELVGELVKLAGEDSPLAGLTPGEAGTRDGGLAALEDPGRWESYESLLEGAGREEVSAEAAAPPPAEQAGASMHSFGALFCEARVSAVTGEVRVARLLGSFDCGRILNAKTAASQFRGGMIMGLGLALMEETLFDGRSGRVMNPGLADYHIPVHADVPPIEVLWTGIPDPRAPMGARGVGEIGITGVGAAVASAVFNATGIRVRDLPLTPDKLL